MPKKFKVLRLVSLFYKALAWFVLALAVLLAVLSIVVGALQARVGAPSPMLAPYPVANQVTGLAGGILVGVLLLVAGLLQFLIVFGTGEAIQLAVALEANTRKTAYYLSGEGALPPPPEGATWDDSSEVIDLEG